MLTENQNQENFIAQQRSPHTQRAYRQDLVAWNEFVDGRPVDESLVIEWRNHLEAKHSNATAIRRYNTTRTYYLWLNDSYNPFARVKAPRRISDWSPIVPDESKIDALFKVCTNQKHRAIIALLANGLRAQEIVDLKPEDYVWNEQYETYIIRVTGKGMKMRLVPASDETIREMQGIALPFPRLNIRKVYYIVKRWSKEAGIEGLHPHALRHGYATRLVRAKVSVFSLQRLLGHADPRTTGTYVNLDLSDLVEAAASDPRNGAGIERLPGPHAGLSELPLLSDGNLRTEEGDPTDG